MAEHAHFFSLLEVENDKAFEGSRREGTDQHIRDVRTMIEAGQRTGSIVDDDPTLLALGAVGSVGYYSHYHRTGRLDVEIGTLARFVATSVVRTMAVDDEIAAMALAN